MVLPKLETASLAPPPPKPPLSRLEKLKRLEEAIKEYSPVLWDLGEYAVGASIGGLAIVASVTALLCGIGSALHILLLGAKMLMG